MVEDYLKDSFSFYKLLESYLKFDSACVNACLGKNTYRSYKMCEPDRSVGIIQLVLMENFLTPFLHPDTHTSSARIEL